MLIGLKLIVIAAYLVFVQFLLLFIPPQQSLCLLCYYDISKFSTCSTNYDNFKCLAFRREKIERK